MGRTRHQTESFVTAEGDKLVGKEKAAMRAWREVYDFYKELLPVRTRCINYLAKRTLDDEDLRGQRISRVVMKTGGSSLPKSVPRVEANIYMIPRGSWWQVVKIATCTFSLSRGQEQHEFLCRDSGKSIELTLKSGSGKLR